MATASSVLLLQRWLVIVACLRIFSGDLYLASRWRGRTQAAAKRERSLRWPPPSLNAHPSLSSPTPSSQQST
jgi:hypothetical protein